MTSEIIKEILKTIPDGKISEATFEGANIVLYTKDRKFFLDDEGLIKSIVDKIKKRIELRPDTSICIESEKAEEEIRKLIPKEAGVDNLIFDARRSIVIIEAEKPGMTIGKQGSILKDIKEKTFWVPVIKRTPPIRSKIVEDIRAVLYENSDERRNFLANTGKRVYNGWIRGKKHEWIRLTQLGGGRQVGRSSILLQTPESRILIDCGVNVAANDDSAYPHLEAPDFRIDELDAVIISHSHLDHCGFLPYLFKYGYKGPVYCTAPTRDVMSLLLLDYVKIMRSEGVKEPIFSTDDIKEMVKHTIPLEYGEVSDITPDVRITLYNAGHILGSSLVHVHIGNGLHNFVYTGDFKYQRSQLLDSANNKFPRVETLMIEATYGGKDNNLPSRQANEEYLAKIIMDTTKRGGKVLIPVLGVGRAQEVMMIVHQLVKNKKMDPMPIHIDGMVWDITAIHTAYPEFLNAGVRKMIFHKDQNPFLDPMFTRVGSVKERKQLLEDTGPAVIMATSGMLVGGPSVEYLKYLADNKKNSLVFVSFQGEGSLGRRIQRGEREIMMSLGGNKTETMKINIEIHTIEGFTGHAGRQELTAYVHRCDPKPKKVIINHGESSKCIDLASTIHKSMRIETIAPRNLETIRLK
ncbi:beta-CASP ribonuclease aCPSF1 [Candidatus Woesearchaeota archaeon]|nr:beta-CASP ribonuclease aCPSF1 [Candidatus Woesearchaeota archaeon]